MPLKQTFDSASNLAPIAQKWLSLMEDRFASAGIDVSVKPALDGAASLIAAPAMIAHIIKTECFPLDKPLSVLLIADDPLAIMDEGIWLSFVTELTGATEINFFSTCNQAIHSNLYEPATQLGLRGYESITFEQAKTRDWDLVVVFHPALENDESTCNAKHIADFARKGQPVIACMYNELDALVQSYGLNGVGYEFSWLNGPQATTEFGRKTVNRFGYATAEVGIEGGWGAVLTKVQPASFEAGQNDWAMIKTAMSLYRLDGSTSGPWPMGQSITGVAFNKTTPIALIGNLAVDPASGVLLSECIHTKVLLATGRIHHELLERRPNGNLALLPWAAEVRLLATNSLTKEDKHYEKSVALLEDAYKAGLVSAGIALARGLEGHGAIKGKEQAFALYSEIGERHPYSCYVLGHDAYAAGKVEEATKWFTIAAQQHSYTPAMCDLGTLFIEQGNATAGHSQYLRASECGDDTGSYQFGIVQYEYGDPLLALKYLRKAWEVGNTQALEVANWIVGDRLTRGLGDRGRLTREKKDIQFAINKRTRLTEQAKRAVN